MHYTIQEQYVRLKEMVKTTELIKQDYKDNYVTTACDILLIRIEDVIIAIQQEEKKS